MKNTKNPELNIGDRIILYHMEDKHGVDSGTQGTVSDINIDPFDKDNKIIWVNWDDGTRLALLSKYDVWKFAKKKSIDESAEQWFETNGDLLKYFKYNKIRKFLIKVRESGIINMFAASPLLYSGKDHIDRYYGENPPDEEAFQEVLDMAEEIKHTMIRGTMEYLEAEGKELSVENINRHIRKMADKMWEFYGNFI
jgi:hypothetical protein